MHNCNVFVMNLHVPNNARGLLHMHVCYDSGAQISVGMCCNNLQLSQRVVAFMRA